MAKLALLVALVAPATVAFCPSFVHRPSVALRAAAPSDVDDGLIYELAECAAFDLPAKVRQPGVLRAVGRPQFFLRIAEICDDCPEGDREKLAALADNLASTLAVIVESAEEKLDDASDVLQTIVVAAAEDDGEFLVPLSAERFAALQEAVDARVVDGSLGESVLSTVDAWAKKADDDGLDGMVAILRKVLQLYAARALRFDAKLAAEQLAQMMPPDAADKVDLSGDAPALHPDYEAAAELYGAVLRADADAWAPTLNAALNGDGAVKKRNVLAIVQAQIERVVLLQENGSFSQRVQAEFLRELVQQVEREAPKSPDDDLDMLELVQGMDLGSD